MKWLRRKIWRWFKDGEKDDMSAECVPCDPGNKYITKASHSRHGGIGAQGTDVTFYKANGGYVVECKYFNMSADRLEHTLYVVNGEEELGEAISKILTMEALRR